MFSPVNLVCNLLMSRRKKERTFSAPMLISITANNIRGAANSGLPIAVLAVRIAQQHTLRWASLFGGNLQRSTAQRWKSIWKLKPSDSLLQLRERRDSPEKLFNLTLRQEGGLKGLSGLPSLFSFFPIQTVLTSQSHFYTLNNPVWEEESSKTELSSWILGEC